MGKGGAPTTTQTVQNQNVAYVPTGLQGFQQIYNNAAQVASQPYQPYTGQLVQGLTPTQTGAIGNISNIAASPLTSGQIQQYMNPFQSNVIDATMANINETNQEQMAQTTGQLTQAAGGIGADRIALGQGELARQQALASNQTLAGLQQQNYAQAVGTAQQQQGFGLGAAQAQLGAGTLQQQTGQAGLTAQYQQYLQQLAFPYQQAQFLAGIGIPALGGMGGQQFQTGTANQTITPPGLSWLQGLAGAGALGYGLFGGSGGIGSGGTTTGDQGSARGGAIHHYDSGGDTNDYDNPDKTIDLGPDDYHEQQHDQQASDDAALAPVLSDKGYIPDTRSPQTPNNQIKPMSPLQMPSQQQSGSSGGSGILGDIADIGKAVATVIPFLKEGGPVGYDDGGIVPQQMQGQTPYPTPNSYPTPSMLGRPLTMGALPMQSQMGSPRVSYGNPLPNMLPSYPIIRSLNPNQATNNIYEQMRQVMQQRQLGQQLAAMRSRMAGDYNDVSISAQEYARGGNAYDDGGATDDGSNILGYPTDDTSALEAALRQRASDLNRFAPDPSRKIPPYIQLGNYARSLIPSLSTPAAARTPDTPSTYSPPPPPPPSDSAPSGPNPMHLPGQIGDDNSLEGWEINPNRAPDRNTYQAPSQPAPASYAGPSPVRASTPASNDLPDVPSEIDRPTVSGLMGNPDFWVRAGLNILSANPAQGPIGAIASGANATVGEYDKWSKDDLSAAQKGFELAAKLKEHTDKYTRLTPAESARIAIENERLQQGRWQAFNYQDEGGQLRAGFMNTKTRQLVGADGQPVNPSRIYGRNAGPSIAKPMSDKELLAATPGATVDDLPALRAKYNSGLGVTAPPPPRPQGMSDAQIRAQAQTAIGQNPQARGAVINRLRAWGINADGL